MKLRLLPLLVATAVVPVAIPVFAQSKIAPVKVRLAIVDFDRCVNETEDGLRAKATLAKAKLRRESQLLVMQERIKGLEQDLQERMRAFQSSGKLPDAKFQQDASDYQKMAIDYEATVRQVNAELGQLDDQLFLPIEKKVKAIFARLAEAQGFDLFVDRKAMPFNLKPDLDLTEQVIREYDWGPPAAAPSASAAKK
jgi:outer membrane protein